MSEPIEEAWGPAAYGERQVPNAPEGVVEGLSEEERVDAARALALASLEAACPFPPQVCARYAKQSAVHCLHQVVRAQIEKLGR
jgi:hypothetical protein